MRIEVCPEFTIDRNLYLNIHDKDNTFSSLIIKRRQLYTVKDDIPDWLMKKQKSILLKSAQRNAFSLPPQFAFLDKASGKYLTCSDYTASTERSRTKYTPTLERRQYIMPFSVDKDSQKIMQLAIKIVAANNGFEFDGDLSSCVETATYARVLFVDKEPVAFILLDNAEALSYVTYIYAIAGSHFARILLDYCVAEFPFMYAHVNETNTPSLKLFRSLGFKEVLMPCHYSDVDINTEMCRSLNAYFMYRGFTWSR